MHVNDIEKLKGFGNYSLDVPLGSLIATVDRWIDEDGLILVPDFQRGHVWTQAQQSAFVEFLLRGGKTSPILLNYPGWQQSVSEGEFECVDGLQRLTACLEFMKGHLGIFGGHKVHKIEGVDIVLKHRIGLKFYINELKTRREVLEWYLELNDGGTPHSRDEILRVKELYAKALDR